MRCSNCGSENPVGKKFCGDCGAPLANCCTQCGADNPPGKPFCGDCGAALLAATPRSPALSGQVPEVATTIKQARASTTVDGERKTVTALFADIKGSTELMRELDPEDARAIIDPVLQLMMDAVHRYDGYVVQSAGDGIFALFAPRWHTRTMPSGQYTPPSRCATRSASVVAIAWPASTRRPHRHQHRRNGAAPDSYGRSH